jgi:putative membrane protein
MKVLVLCIDRDDDLGHKAKIEGPVIGRHECVRAALELGIADPEDADTNTMLAAISTYDDLLKKGISAEVATITGDVNVGYLSDLALTKQLEETLEVTMASSVVLVSNGAEDEYIFPMVSSRIKVDSVRNVMVKQSKGVESTWYFFWKIIKEEKTRKQIIAPLGLILLAVGAMLLIPLFKVIGELDAGLIVDEISAGWFNIVIFIMGIYLVQNAFRVRESVRSGVRRARRSIYQGDVTIPMFLLATIIFILGIVKGLQGGTVVLLPQFEDIFTRILLFLDSSFYWFMAAMLIFESRRMVNALIQREIVPRGFWLLPMFIIAATFLVLGGIHYLMVSMALPIYQGDMTMVFMEIGIGLGVAISGAIMQRRMKTETWVSKEGWRR